MKRPKNLKAIEIPKPVRNDNRVCANLYAAAVRNDKFNVIASDAECGARQSGSGFCGLLRRSFITPRNDGRMHAFTLAEVLITLVIIGVVAALTIPNLMQKYTEQTTVKKVQKFYSTLSNAYSLAVKDNGPVDDWGLDWATAASAEKIYELLFKPYFKIAKNCGVTTDNTCIFNGKYKCLDNSEGSRLDASNFYKMTLDDGSSVIFYSYARSAPIVIVVYDINGSKKPNQYGVDTFSFRTKDKLIIPYGFPSSGYYFNDNCKKSGGTAGAGTGCSAWIVYKGNMDYLHCDGLSWTGKDKCK